MFSVLDSCRNMPKMINGLDLFNMVVTVKNMQSARDMYNILYFKTICNTREEMGKMCSLSSTWVIAEPL